MEAEAMDWRNLPLTLTAAETAVVLRISIDTTKRMLRDGRLHGRKAGREWRVSRDMLQSWLEHRSPTITPPDN